MSDPKSAPDPKRVIESAITRAQDELTGALSELQKISILGAGGIGYATHALSNYLAVTSAAVRLISRRVQDHPDTQVSEWLDGVSHATDMMANVVRQLMNASLTDDADLRFERIDLVLMVLRFSDSYQQIASQKSIRLILDSMPDVPPVRGDRVAVLSVLDNLVSNAIKYSMPGTRIWLRVRREAESVVCEVQDEGPGLDEKDQVRLFQRGVRLTPRPTAGEPSTGYGLAIARDLMDRLGGEIWCVSALGHGTSFFIRLPAHKDQDDVGGREPLAMG